MENANKKIIELYEVYYRPLCLYALYFVKDVDSVEDIVHDCFIELLAHIKGGRVVNSYKAYLYTMVRNRSLATAKSANKIVSVDGIDIATEDEMLIEQSNINAQIWKIIDTLPPRCREIFLMNKRDGMTYSEIANELGISVKSVENHMTKANSRVKPLAKKLHDYSFLQFLPL